jgi:hypothetical protein
MRMNNINKNVSNMTEENNGSLSMDSVFHNIEQIIKWEKKLLPFSVVCYEKEFAIQRDNFFIIAIDGCSGVYCSNISIYKQIENTTWKLVKRYFFGQMKESIEIRIDSENEKVIFKTESDTKVIEILFRDLILDSDL